MDGRHGVCGEGGGGGAVREQRRPYEEARSMIEDMGGSADWCPGGYGGGGVFKLELHGRHHEIPVRPPYTPNDFDRLYVPNVPEPMTWRDFGGEDGHQLQHDAFWRLIGYFTRSVEGG